MPTSSHTFTQQTEHTSLPRSTFSGIRKQSTHRHEVFCISRHRHFLPNSNTTHHKTTITPTHLNSLKAPTTSSGRTSRCLTSHKAHKERHTSDGGARSSNRIKHANAHRRKPKPKNGHNTRGSFRGGPTNGGGTNLLRARQADAPVPPTTRHSQEWCREHTSQTKEDDKISTQHVWKHSNSRLPGNSSKGARSDGTKINDSREKSHRSNHKDVRKL